MTDVDKREPRLWRWVYNVIVVPIAWLAFRVYALVHSKAARALRGRTTVWKQLESFRDRYRDGKCVWFHASSMGEFEQAKPIIAELKKRWPDVRIVVSFFSPSGYEHTLNYKLADTITYIPFDSHRNAKRFMETVRPSAAIFLRYDVWPNHLWALQRAGIPTFIVSATLQSTTMKQLPIVKQILRETYNSVDYILAVSGDDRTVFQSYRLTHPIIDIIGDTRYDQVWRRSAESKSRRVLDEKLLRDKKVLVVGSSWKEDEEMLLPVCLRLLKTHPELLVVLVPHEPTMENLERIENELNGHVSYVRFSEMSHYRNEPLVMVDSVGILMPLYQYAHIAYVGGSFKGGVHNVLEPAAYGVPIVIGPKHENSQEAIELVRREAACVGRDGEELYHCFRVLLDDEARRILAGERGCTLVQQNLGATQRVLSLLERVLQGHETR